MLVVVDANVIFSALVKKGNQFKVFETNKIFKKFEFIAPDFLFTELGEKLDKLLLQSSLTKEELSEVFSFIKKQIDFVSFSGFSDKLKEAEDINFKDSPYLALALKLNCPIFSGDKALKEQTKVKVLNARDLLERFRGDTSVQIT